jgi:glycosyltransferase involved in cell wall biosynthesis
VNPEKVHVVYSAPKSVFKKIKDDERLERVKEKYSLPENFFLYVGDVNYNKNIPTLLKAVKRAGKNLIIVGKQAKDIEGAGLGLEALTGPMDWVRYLFGVPHPENAHYEKLLKLVKSTDKIRRLGFVSDEDLSVIYNLADTCVQPSFYEGFGLPILEAIESGTSVIASKINAHKEMAGDAAVYFGPKNVSELTKLLKKGVKKKGGLPRKYSWEKTAIETYNVYKSA